MRQKSFRIQVNRVSAGRLHHRYAGIDQFVGQVFHTADPVLEIMFIHDFLQTDRDRFEVTSGQSAIGRKAFGNDLTQEYKDGYIINLKETYPGE